MGVLVTVTLDASRRTEADVFEDGSVRLWAGRRMKGAQAWSLKSGEVDKLFAALLNRTRGVGGFGAEAYEDESPEAEEPVLRAHMGPDGYMEED